jgi:predicted DNA-binding transcriptional regulator YafY
MANRQLAILQILECGRIVTCRELSEKTESSRHTVMRDLLDLSVDYPIETILGNGGGVRMIAAAKVGRQYLCRTELAYIAKTLLEDGNPDIEIRDSILRKIAPWE